MKITFYYWGKQCPIIEESLNLLSQYAHAIEVELFDITYRSDLTALQNMYFPFLTVFDDSKRWFGPLRADILDSYIEREAICEKPYVIVQGTEVFCGELVELSDQNFDLIKDGCSLSNCLESCQKKKAFLSEMGEPFYGMLNLENGKVVGGIEYLPSIKVPYPIPKSERTAFITCVYHSSTEYDYKTKPFEALEIRLKGKFDKIVAVTDKLGTFPNGTLEWFIRNGFVDQGVISTEEGYCELHLVSKMI